MYTPILSTHSNQYSVAFEDAVFSSRDGCMLSGWFMPDRKGLPVILTHGIGGNRLDLMSIYTGLAQWGFYLADKTPSGQL